MKLKELIRILESKGFQLTKQGSHMTYSNGAVKVHVPRHKELNGKTVHFILRMADGQDTKNSEFRKAA